MHINLSILPLELTGSFLVTVRLLLIFFCQIIIKVPYLFYSHVVHIILLGQLFGTNFSWNIRGQFWVPCYHCGIFCPSLCYFSRRYFWIGIFCQKIKQTQTSGIWRIKLKIEFIKIVATIIPKNHFVSANYQIIAVVDN